jgi:two-component system sensor histidine kinase VicK
MSLSPQLPDVDILQQIAERSMDGFFLYHLKTAHFSYVNTALEEIIGLSRQRMNEDLPGLRACVHPEDLPTLQKGYERLLSSAFRQSVEIRIRMSDHTEKWLLLTAYLIMQEQERYSIAGFASDITQQKENEIIANKYSAHKNAILEMLAHDLGGPLGAVKALASHLLEQGREKGLKEIEEPAQLIKQTAERSIHLIHELLEQEYLESSETGLQKQRVELIEQIEFHLEGFRRLDITMEKVFELVSTSPTVWVVIDQTKFLQVISNLVSNAAKFTPEDGHITVRVTEQPESIRLSVEDNGIGIPADLQPFVFDRFTKARRPGLRGEETVGLGLSIVKRIVELHQGRVWLESTEHQGARVHIEIPRGD